VVVEEEEEEEESGPRAVRISVRRLCGGLVLAEVLLWLFPGTSGCSGAMKSAVVLFSCT
jgi:hypothetical protein